MDYYQIGNQCLDEKTAENVFYTSIAPAIKPDGSLWRPEFDGNQWTYEGQVLQLNLPKCSPVENYSDGLIYGWSLLFVVASLFVFGEIRRLLK